MKIAFLTDQYTKNKKSSGGVGNYLSKMAYALHEHGHTVEIFVLSNISTEIDDDGIIIHNVKKPRSIPYRAFNKFIRTLFGEKLSDIISLVINSYLLNKYFQTRDQKMDFDIVQSTNFPQTGIFLKKKKGRKHYLRLSTSRLLFDRASFIPINLSQKITERIDLFCIKKADHAYSPSLYLANYFKNEYGLEITVMRPPAILSIKPEKKIPFELPHKYLIHYGILGQRKGTDLVAKALEKAWKQRPDLKMVWVGRYSMHFENNFHTKLPHWNGRLIWYDFQPPSILYAMVRNSIASVLPSRADNLPNTVIESLLLNVPVIAFSDASIDELVESGINGKLVSYENTDALAESMVQAWDKGKDWLSEELKHPFTFNGMDPSVAVDSFLKLSVT